MKLLGKIGLACLASVLVSACGSSTNSGTPVTGNLTYTRLTDTNATGVSTLEGVGVNTASGTVSRATGGTYDHGTKRYNLNGETGAINFVAGGGTIDGGGSVTVFGLEDYVSGITAQATGAATELGFVGVPSTTAEMAKAPAMASYAGASKVVINDATSLWTLDGTATAQIDFAAGSGSALLSNLDGTKADFGGGTSAVTDVATIGINNIAVSGNTFSSNQVALSSSQVNGFLSGSSVIDIQGGFYGPAAANIGGVVSVDDSAGGGVTIQGAFTGKQ